MDDNLILYFFGYYWKVNFIPFHIPGHIIIASSTLPWYVVHKTPTELSVEFNQWLRIVQVVVVSTWHWCYATLTTSRLKIRHAWQVGKGHEMMEVNFHHFMSTGASEKFLHVGKGIIIIIWRWERIIKFLLLYPLKPTYSLYLWSNQCTWSTSQSSSDLTNYLLVISVVSISQLFSLSVVSISLCILFVLLLK